MQRDDSILDINVDNHQGHCLARGSHTWILGVFFNGLGRFTGPMDRAYNSVSQRIYGNQKLVRRSKLSPRFYTKKSFMRLAETPVTKASGGARSATVNRDRGARSATVYKGKRGGRRNKELFAMYNS